MRSGEGQSFAYSGRSLTRISSASTPSTPASATPGSAPCRTSALDQARLAGPGFTRSYDISYRGVKLPRVSAALGRSYLRRGADLPQAGALAGLSSVIKLRGPSSLALQAIASSKRLSTTSKPDRVQTSLHPVSRTIDRVDGSAPFHHHFHPIQAHDLSEVPGDHAYSSPVCF